MSETKRPVGKPRHYEDVKHSHTIRVTDTVWEWVKSQHPRGVSGFIESLHKERTQSHDQ